MKNLLFLVVGMTIMLFAGNAFASNAAGCVGDCEGGGAESTDAAGYCAQFDFDSFNFLLTVDTNGTGHTLGDWCTDWAPVGSVNAIPLGQNWVIVQLNLAGAGNDPNCADSINISGLMLVYAPLNITLGSKLDWMFPNSPVFSFKGISLCRS